MCGKCGKKCLLNNSDNGSYCRANGFNCDGYGNSIQVYINKSDIKSNDPWDNLEVGQEIQFVVVNTKKSLKALEVTENLFAFYEEGLGIVWYEKEKAKQNGWTIKDSTPKEEEELKTDECVKHEWQIISSSEATATDSYSVTMVCVKCRKHDDFWTELI